MAQEEWIKTLEDGRKVKFIYQELPEDGAFITAQIAGNEVVYSVVLTKARNPLSREDVESHFEGELSSPRSSEEASNEASIGSSILSVMTGTGLSHRGPSGRKAGCLGSNRNFLSKSSSRTKQKGAAYTIRVLCAFVQIFPRIKCTINLIVNL